MYHTIPTLFPSFLYHLYITSPICMIFRLSINNDCASCTTRSAHSRSPNDKKVLLCLHYYVHFLVFLCPAFAWPICWIFIIQSFVACVILTVESSSSSRGTYNHSCIFMFYVRCIIILFTVTSCLGISKVPPVK